LDDAQILRALAPELPNARLSTADSLMVQQRALFATGNALGFRFEHDLNGDGVTDLLLLGEYQDGLIHSTFALIATMRAGEWRRVSLLTFDKDFIVGAIGPTGAIVFFCLSCDLGGPLKWTGSSYVHEPDEPGPKASDLHETAGEEK